MSFLGSYNGKNRLQHKFSKKIFFLNNPMAHARFSCPEKVDFWRAIFQTIWTV